MGPIADFADIVGGELGVPVDPEVGAERHAAGLDFAAHGFQAVEGVHRLFHRANPFGKVQVAAALIHVVDDKPRHRGDIRVPRPASSVGMAIGAGSVERGGHVGRDVQDVFHHVRGIDRRVGAGRADDLGGGEEEEGEEKNIFEGYQKLGQENKEKGLYD